jgi:hypothetical protein
MMQFEYGWVDATELPGGLALGKQARPSLLNVGLQTAKPCQAVPGERIAIARVDRDLVVSIEQRLGLKVIRRRSLSRAPIASAAISRAL